MSMRKSMSVHQSQGECAHLCRENPQNVCAADYCREHPHLFLQQTLKTLWAHGTSETRNIADS